MKFLHTGDLHIGKKLFEASVLEDQAHILNQIHEIALAEQVQAVVLAGDLYDRSVPPAEAVTLLDDFLTRLVQAGIPVIAVSGNHDSPERISFGEKILEKQGLYLAGVYEGSLRRVEISDGETKVCFVCLPFVRPAQVEETTSAGAVARILYKEGLLADDISGQEQDKDTEQKQEKAAAQENTAEGPMTGSEGMDVCEVPMRQVLVTHYFVTGENGQAPQLADSETSVDVGGIDNIPADVFKAFDYVALGHIHRCQQVGEGPIWYAGAPMKYSFSETRDTKSVNIVELRGQDPVTVTRRYLTPIREMRCIKGQLRDLIRPETVGAEGVSSEDYIQATLTDREELIDPIGVLRSVYPNVMQILSQRYEEAGRDNYVSRLQGRRREPQELFGDFYEMLTGEKLSESQRELARDVAERLLSPEG
jgi:exonuclease SbcD